RPSGIASVILALSSVGAAEQKPLVAGPGPTSSKNPLTDEFGEFVAQKLDKWKVPGMSLAVIDGDDIYTEGYGFATLPDTKATPETLWYGASATKAQVAATLAQLIASKQHPQLADGWSTTMSSILRDDFVQQDEWAMNHITLEDAASHRTGMARHDKSSARVINGTQVVPRDIVRNLRNLRNLPLAAKPRVTFYYCNLMYVTLGHAIETITGKWQGRAAGTGAPCCGILLGQAHPGVQGGRPDGGRGRRRGRCRHIYRRRLRLCLLHAAPFSRSVHRDIKKPRMLATTAPRRGLDISLYGLAWNRKLSKGHVIYTHAGGMHAFGAQVYWLPDAKFGAVAFANTAWTSNAVEDVIIYRLIHDKLGIPESERIDFDKDWEEEMDKTTGEVKDADKILFPDQPEPPLPSMFKTSDLVAGREDPRGRPRRYDMAVPIQPYHVSGDYWVVYTKTPWNPTFPVEFQPGEFHKGVDGKASGLEIKWMSRTGSMEEGKAFFKRVS
ncbi:Uncharacterized protein TPAR_06918, partial [Tolypocladium paradoxum]